MIANTKSRRELDGNSARRRLTPPGKEALLMRSIDQSPRPDPSAGEYDGAPTDSVQLHDYLLIVRRRRWLIAAIIAVGLLCGVTHNWMTVPVYEAQATLQLDMDLNVLGVDRPLAPLDQRDWMREFLPTQLGVLESRELARRARSNLDRSDDSGSGGSGVMSQIGSPQRPEVGVEPSVARVPTVDEIVAGRSVSSVKDSRLVNVAFRSTEPALTSQVANALARAYLQQNSRVPDERDRRGSRLARKTG